MSKSPFNKQALTIDQQVEFLSTQGLVIDDIDTAKHVLSTIGYYRLSSYLLPFKSSHNHNSPRKFKSSTQFNEIWQLYQFDRELKLLVADAIEKIEVAFRAAITNEMATLFDPFWYTERIYYRDTKPYENLMRDIKNIIKGQGEIFIEHYYSKYNSPEYPPIWMMMETLSFGACSKLFANLKQVSHKKKICEIFNRAPTIMDSWLETMVYIRNVCAHHARLWNRWLVDAPMIPKLDPIHNYLQERNRRFIVCAYILICLLQPIAPKSHWKQKLYDLFVKYENYPGVAMGFMNNWKSDPFWEI